MNHVPTSCIGGFRRHDPPRICPQEAVLEFAAARYAAAATAAGEGDATAMRRRYAALVDRVACPPQHIATRRSIIADLPGEGPATPLYAWAAHPGGAPWEARAPVWLAAGTAACEALLPAGPAPDELLHVTCTGYTSPSPIQLVAAQRGWTAGTRATHLYHMGCYAALPALRLADGMVGQRTRDGAPCHVAVAHTEWCTLHFDPRHRTAEQVVAHSLFADGAIAYDVADPGDPGGRLDVLAHHEQLIPDSDAEMTWVFADASLRMTLTIQVPVRIREHLPGFLTRLAAAAGLDAEMLRRTAVWAIHPGGPRILRDLQGLLGLSERQTEHSWGVLRERGNMSSATVPHIWERIAADPAIASGTPVVTLAFGPGLTIAGALLRKR